MTVVPGTPSPAVASGEGSERLHMTPLDLNGREENRSRSTRGSWVLRSVNHVFSPNRLVLSVGRGQHMRCLRMPSGDLLRTLAPPKPKLRPLAEIGKTLSSSPEKAIVATGIVTKLVLVVVRKTRAARLSPKRDIVVLSVEL